MQSPALHRNPAPDVLVVGAGVFGLSVAWSCRASGLRVRVLEAGRAGQGASGGIVGALTPHAPSRWRPMMEFQFRALLSLADRVAEIETATGLDCGYARLGRLTPLPTEKARAGAERDAEAAPGVWGDAAAFSLLDDGPHPGWPASAPFGLVHDTVSARIDPRAYVGALAAGLGDCIEEGVAVSSFSHDGVAMTGGGPFAAGSTVISAGWQSWSLLPEFSGAAVKGQAALLQADASDLPVIYADGLYVIPHGSDRVAVGSTSEKRFDQPFTTDGLLDDVLARAGAVCPLLVGAPVVERWAGLRPKPPSREPVVGPVPGRPGLWIAGGGYKISFGIAHAVGDAVAAGITGQPGPIPLPESFAPNP